MKSILAAALFGTLASLPAVAQEQLPYPSQYPPGDQLSANQAVDRQLVAEIQQLLREQGVYSGPVNGNFSPRTQQALAEWQLNQGLPATGRLDSQTIAALGVAEGVMPQQAQVPENLRQPGEIESLRDDYMSAPNVVGDETQNQVTGVPAPAEDVPPRY